MNTVDAIKNPKMSMVWWSKSFSTSTLEVDIVWSEFPKKKTKKHGKQNPKVVYVSRFEHGKISYQLLTCIFNKR